MKSSKKALAFALAAAMVVTAFPVTNAEAASTAKLSTTKVTVAAGTAKKQTKSIKVTTPSTWKSVKVKVSSSNKKVATVKASGKTVKVTAVKKGSAKVTVKVTAKKGKKAVSKKLTAKVTVINAGLKFTAASTEMVVGAEDKVVVKKSPKAAKVTLTSSDETIATVAEDGTVKALKAGDVTITAASDYGKTATTAITVKKAIVKSAEQTEYNKIEAVIVGDTRDMKAGDIKVTNTATKATVAVKSVSAKKGAENTYVIETFTGMTDAKEYSVEYAGSVAAFTATDNTVDTVALTKTEVPAGIKTEVKAVTKDAKGVILGYFDLTNASSAKGQVTTALTITKGYVQGSDVYLPAVGDTMAAKLTYHTGSFATDGTETGIKEATATITAVDPSTVTYNYAVTFGTSAPTWTATSFKAVTAIKVGDASKNAYFRITDENGKEIDATSYTGYTVETADPTKLVLNAQSLTATTYGTTGVPVKGVAAGDTYILVKKDGKVVFSLPVSVQGKATATSIDLNKASVTIMSGAAAGVAESIEAKLKDQYTDDMNISSVAVELLGKPNDANDVAIPTSGVVNVTVANSKKVTVTVNAAAFATAANKTGTYTYKMTLKDDANKAIVRTFTVNVVNQASVQAYQLDLPTEVNTTVTKNTDQNDITVSAKVVEIANGAKVDDYNIISGVANSYVTYTVKDASGKDVDSAICNGSNHETLAITVVSNSGTKFQKNLKAGTYYVTAKFKVADANGTWRDVAVSGSFTIKDTQDTAASINVKENDLANGTISAALANTAYAVVTYDGVRQNLSGNIYKIHGTKAGNTAYVTSVEVFVTVTDSTNEVLITIPVNQKFTNVSAASEALLVD